MEKKRKLVDMAIEYEIIKEKDRPIYELAISSLFFSLLTWGTFLFLGILFIDVNGCLIFLLFHIPLRIYAGGFHQNTKVKCYVQSLIIFLLILLGSTSIIHSWIMDYWCILMVLAFFIIWFLSPVEALNKPLTSEEQKHHKIVSRFILFIETIALAIFAFNNLHSFLYFSFVSIQIVAIQLVLGLVKYKLIHGNK